MNRKESEIRALIAEGEYSLAEGPHPERARRDAETLLLHVLNNNSHDGHIAWLTLYRIEQNINSAWLVANRNLSASPIISEQFKNLVMRRRAGEPIQYITGEAEFYGLPFRVTRDVLIPRPETEHLVEKALDVAARFAQPRIADIGAGSGAIAIALAHKLPRAKITAIDLSAAALGVARKNAARNLAEEKIRFLEGDLLEPVAGEQFEIIVSNPPYVPAADRATLSVEVRDFEPPLALFAGEDGQEVVRRLIPAACAALAPGGFLLLEIGHGQSDSIRRILAHSGFEQIEFIPDLQGIPRVAWAQRPC